jgi:para-aminobenzoate synthetase/4-amino-4-deoxychorismate lyase
VIAELESTPRGVYTGAIGFASPVAGLELNVAIRTFEFRGERAWLGVGGGIVADSDPVAEAAECLTKAQPLLTAIGARLERAAAPPDVSPPPPRRMGPVPVPRPDPAAGVFETLLVSRGHPVALHEHLERLARSVRTLYGASLPGGLAADLLTEADRAGSDRARMRVDFRPGSGIVVRLTDAPRRTGVARLSVRTVPGGIGPHKWADRRLLGAIAADSEHEPLLCDLDGLVLETARANVFIVEASGRIVTPPADGRILPGVTRALVIELAGELGLPVDVEPLGLARLGAAREVFLTGSLAGVEPAQLDGRPAGDGGVTGQLAGDRGVTGQLADALRAATHLVPSPARA